MRTLTELLGPAVFIALASACSRAEPPPPAPARGALTAGTAAMVGPDAVSIATVQRIAEGEHINPRAARWRAIQDALFAAGARERLRGTGRIRSAVNAALARRLLEQLKARAAAQGPPTDAEIARLTRRHWFELDRPASARTTHAVVLVKKPADDVPAKALAERILAAVDGVHDAAGFKKRVEALPKGDLQVRVESLPPVAADGRVIPAAPPAPGAPVERFDKQFAEAANAIKTVGAHSPVIHTRFGYHVILLDARLPAKHVPLRERRKELAPEAFDVRAAVAEQRILKRLRASTPIQVVRSFDDLTAKVRFQQ